jgi:hypothetical protein
MVKPPVGVLGLLRRPVRILMSEDQVADPMDFYGNDLLHPLRQYFEAHGMRPQEHGKLGLYAQTLENSVKLDFRLPQSGAALAC